jgi:hypothetical protein
MTCTVVLKRETKNIKLPPSIQFVLSKAGGNNYYTRVIMAISLAVVFPSE